MIKVECWTNLDEYRHEQWPVVMACPPYAGGRVQARSGKQLKVHSIIHCERNILGPGGRPTTALEPYLRVELHR